MLCSVPALNNSFGENFRQSFLTAHWDIFEWISLCKEGFAGQLWTFQGQWIWVHLLKKKGSLPATTGNLKTLIVSDEWRQDWKSLIWKKREKATTLMGRNFSFCPHFIQSSGLFICCALAAWNNCLTQTMEKTENFYSPSTFREKE